MILLISNFTSSIPRISKIETLFQLTAIANEEYSGRKIEQVIICNATCTNRKHLIC